MGRQYKIDQLMSVMLIGRLDYEISMTVLHVLCYSYDIICQSWTVTLYGEIAENDHKLLGDMEKCVA